MHQNGGSGITFRYAQQITVRYSESHDHVEYHGIGSKDCFPNEDDVPDSVECRDDAVEIEQGVFWSEETGPGALWSQDYAVYSNRLYNNGDYGINLHASSGEIAGNVSESNFYGSKFPDASRLWIHHNRMDKNSLWGLRIYNTIEVNARQAGNVIVYQNSFSENGDYPIRVIEPAENVILIDNTYTLNVQNRLRINSTIAYACPDTAEETMPVDGEPLQIATEAICDLNSVSTLFPLIPTYIPLSIN